MRRSILCILAVTIRAQQDPGAVDFGQFDPDFITFPDDGIDYPGCFQDLAASDVNGDGVIKSNEYLNFVQKYGERICHYTDRLSLQQRSAFNALACRCQSREGYGQNCCLGGNAQIETAGALDSSRSQEQLSYLTAVCRITDGTIGEPRGCPPLVIDPNDPPPYIFVPATAPAPAGLSNGALAGIIIGAILGALLLMLLCCCCVCKRKKGKEEEEEEEIEAKNVEEGAAPEQSPDVAERSIPVPEPEPEIAVPIVPVVPPAAAQEEDEEGGRGKAILSDEIEDEDIRKARGAAKIPPEEPDPKRIIRGAGMIPENPKNTPRVALNPIEPEEEEDPEWDYPGQAMVLPTEKDEMSAGEVEHYVPDGGVYDPRRPPAEALEWNHKWEKPEVEDPDETDGRKHRIQAGLGEGEVWDKLGETDEPEVQKEDKGDVFDWVVQSALGVLSNTEEGGSMKRQG